jgi:hypothetical protein
MNPVTSNSTLGIHGSHKNAIPAIAVRIVKKIALILRTSA